MLNTIIPCRTEKLRVWIWERTTEERFIAIHLDLMFSSASMKKKKSNFEALLLAFMCFETRDKQFISLGNHVFNISIIMHRNWRWCCTYGSGHIMIYLFYNLYKKLNMTNSKARYPKVKKVTLGRREYCAHCKAQVLLLVSCSLVGPGRSLWLHVSVRLNMFKLSSTHV
jgi:hypothetical protein